METKTQPSETERNVSVERNERNVSLEAQALRSQGLSFKEIGEKLGMSKSKVFRLLNGTVQHQKETVPEPSELDLGPLSNEPPEMMSDMELNLEEKRLKREMNIKRLRAKNAWLDHMTRHPEGYSSGWNENDGHGSRETESMRDLKQEVRDLKQSVQNNPLGYMKLGVDAFKAGTDAVPKAQGIDPTTLMNTYRSGIQDAREELKATTKSSESNIVDLKIAEINQVERLENRKIDFEVLKHQEGKESEKQLYSLIGEVVGADGIIGKIVSGAGEGMKRRIEGGPRLPSVDISCPNCGNKFKANPQLDTVICNGCGASLRKQSQEPQPAQQPQQAPQPTSTTEPQQVQAQQDATSQEKTAEHEGVDVSTEKLSEKPEQEVIQ